VWRAGRWPGPASSFDRAYSNVFAHGKSGNVGETGIAGVQRQQKITDTGWVGQATFNTLRSIRVPQGPHEGEMAMDANAANLVAQAWQLYGGKEPPPPVPAPTKSTRERALAACITHLGETESPAGSNMTKFGSWYGVNGQPWCAIFQTYCWDQEAGGSPSFARGVNYAYVPYVVSDARNHRNGLSVTSSPIPGDLVCYDWGFDGTFDHIGIFEGWAAGSGSTFTAIEGNTSTSSDSNGGEVMRRTRRVPDQSTVFVRVAGP
jgi:CHAP domain